MMKRDVKNQYKKAKYFLYGEKMKMIHIVLAKYVSKPADTNSQCFDAIIWCWTLGGASDKNGGKFK